MSTSDVVEAAPFADARFRSPDLPIPERVEDLLARMTLEEKAAQLLCPFTLDHPHDEVTFDEHGLGGVAWPVSQHDLPPAQTAGLANDLQRRHIESTRLGIPLLFNEEALCGLRACGATELPDAISQGATWDPALIEEMGEMIGRQMRAVGVRQVLSPLCDVAPDPRWGRIEETYGEDPYLVGMTASAFIRGVQGPTPSEGGIASPKHFLGYGASEGGRNTHPVHLGPREMREIYALPFEMAIRTAGMRGVMCAYNQIDGVPVQASRELLTDLLRGELGFDGLLISDLNSAIQLHTRHGVAESAQHAAALSLRAGLDFELGESVFGSVLVEAVRAGIASEDDVDRAVRSVLRWKFELGLFERPYIDIPDEIDLDSAADRDLARRVAEKSIVLLQNRPVEGRPLLPISDDVKRIAVIGPNADRVFGLLGNYTYAVVGSAVKLLSEVILDAGRRVAEQSDASPDNVHPNELADHIELVADDAVPRLTMVPVVTALDGIRARATEGVVIDYAHGCPVERADRSGIDEAIRVAAAADIAIVVVGDQSGILKAATVGESVDSASCALPGVQRELVEAVAGSGTPTIVVLTHGRPYVLGWMADAVPAIVSAWFPGEEGGTAIARVLFGDVNPSGRAPVTFHSRTDTLPMPYNRSHSPGNSYVDAHPEPVFPFGHGLSYTTFDYGDLAISPEETTTDGTVIISCTVTNTGAVSGEDVVQLYLRDPIARSSRPRRELKGFTRVALEPGAAARVTFSLSADRVALYDPTDGWVVEPGLIEVHVGRSSEDLPLAGAFTLRGTARATGRGRELVTPLTTAPLAP